MLKALQDKVAGQRASARKSGTDRNADVSDKGSNATRTASCSATRNSSCALKSSNGYAYVKNLPDDKHARNECTHTANSDPELPGPSMKVLRSYSMSSCDTQSVTHAHARDGGVVQVSSMPNSDTVHVSVGHAPASMVMSRVEQGVNVVQNRSFKASSRALDVHEGVDGLTQSAHVSVDISSHAFMSMAR